MNRHRLVYLNLLCNKMIKMDNRIFMDSLFTGGTVSHSTVELCESMGAFYRELLEEVNESRCNLKVVRETKPVGNHKVNIVYLEYNKPDPDTFSWENVRNVMIYHDDKKIFKRKNKRILDGDDE